MLIGQVENADFSDIADFISPTFINPCFQYSLVVNIENLDFKNSRLSNIRVFRYSPIVNTENTDVRKSRFSNICLKQVFQKSEIFRHPCFRYSPILNIKKTNV